MSRLVTEPGIPESLSVEAAGAVAEATFPLTLRRPKAATRSELVAIRGTNSDAAANSNDAEAVRGANNTVGLDQLIEVAERSDRRFRSLAVPTDSIRLETGRLFAGGHEFTLSRDGALRLGRRLKVPSDYFGRLGPRMRCRLVNYHLRRGDYADRGIGETARVVARGEEFFDIGRPDLLTLGSGDVLRAVQDAIGATASDLEIRHLQTEEASVRVDLVSPRTSHEVRKGDVIRGGLRVAHSLLGEYATRIEGYIDRLVCGNGMVRRECVGQKGTHRSTQRTRRLPGDLPNSREQQIAQVRRLVADTWQKVQHRLSGFDKLREEKFALEGLTVFLRAARLYSDRMLRLLRTAWEHELGGNHEETAFGVLNAITWLGTHYRSLPEEDCPTERQALALQVLAGTFAHRHDHYCPRCLRQL